MPSLGLHAQVLNAQVCMLTLPYRRDDQLGVGLATNRGKVVVVCNYDPPGNFRGRYKENVLPPSL